MTAGATPVARRATRRRIGVHLPLGGGMLKAVDRAVQIGANTIQIFSDNPTAWRRRTEPPSKLKEFRDRLREEDISPLTIHASYLINLAGPEDAFYEQSIELLAHELWTGRLYGARFVNVHIGSHRGKGVEAGIERLSAGIGRVFERLASIEAVHRGGGAREAGADPVLVLENSAGGGGGIGTTVTELGPIFAGAVRCGAPPARLAFGFDTAHLWSAGHDLRDRAAVDRLLGDFDAAIGIEHLALVHLNDSKAALGSRLDRHEHIGAGEIGAKGLRNVLRHRMLRRVPFYLETPGMDEGYDAVNMERVRLLIAGRRLPPLPPEALLVRGSRSRRAMPEQEPEPEAEPEQESAARAQAGG